MKLTLVRHATLLLETSGKRILVDPMLSAAGTQPPIEDTPNQVPNPLVDLPVPAADVVAGIDGVVVTHLHEDHWDEDAAALLPRTIPLLTQPGSLDELRAQGFTAATDDPHEWLGLDVARTSGRHGTGAIGDELGPVSGFVIDGVYIAGDTILCEEVESAIAEHSPRAIVVNGSGARFLEGDPIVMDANDVAALRDSTGATVVVIHLEAINHCVERRDVYRALGGVLVPDDGETVEL